MTQDSEAVRVEQIDIDAANELARILEIADWATGRGYFASHLKLAFACHRRDGMLAAGDAFRSLEGVLKVILTDLGQPGSDGWTNGYVHVTDLDRLQQAISALESAALGERA